MIQKVIAKHALNDPEAAKVDLLHWLSKPAQERVEAVDFLRKQHYGSTARLQRTARVIQRARR